MVILQQEDYDRMSDQVVHEFITSGTPLNDGLYKIATTQDLTPAQLRNLVWQCNTKAHLLLFEKQANDKNIEFPVADFDYLLRRLHAPMPEQPLPETKTAAMREQDFYTEIKAPLEKTAKEEFAPFIVEKPAISAKTAAYRRGKALRTMHKAASELEHNVYIEREGYMDDIHQLAWNLRVNGGRDEFEKDAYAIYGEDVLPVLNDARAVYRLEITTTEKVASEVDRLVDTTSHNFVLLKNARQHYTEAVKYAQALKWLDEKLKDIQS